MAYLMAGRTQKTFLPPSVEDYISSDDQVRAYDAFVEALDFGELGIPLMPGGNAVEYYPKMLMKVLVFGYAYGIRSSRKLERACHHNLAFIWLTSGLKPDFRTIGRFRRQHREALKKVLKQCVRMCINLELVDGNALFMDGTGIRANACIKNDYDIKRCKLHIHAINERIEKLVDDNADEDMQEEEQESLVRLKKELRNENKLLSAVKEFAKETGRKKMNTVDPDSVTIKSRQGIHAGYKAQVVADGKYGLVVTTEAVSHSTDINQLTRQLEQAKEILNKKPEIVCADAGYYNPREITKVDSDVQVIVPSPKVMHQERGHKPKPFDKDFFTYDEKNNEYICPEGKKLRFFGTHKKGQRAYRASWEDCRKCPHFGVCTRNGEGRSIDRMEHEILQQKLAAVYKSPQAQATYRLRKQIIELIFGHFKSNLGAGQFLLRGRSGTNAELSILSTGFNIARMITILGGVQAFIRTIQAC